MEYFFYEIITIGKQHMKFDRGSGSYCCGGVGYGVYNGGPLHNYEFFNFKCIFHCSNPVFYN